MPSAARARACVICATLVPPGERFTRGRKCGRCAWTRRSKGVIDSCTRFEHDEVAKRFVAEHPSGATLEALGVMFGVTRERLRQIEETALKKLAVALAREGVVCRDDLSISEEADVVVVA